MMKFYSLYSHMPIFIQNIMCSVFGYKEARVRFNTEFKLFLMDLKRTDKASLNLVENIKNEKLKKALLNAKKHPFYNEIMKDITELDIKNNPFGVLSKMPVLYKDDVRNYNMNSIVKSGDVLLSTSGTSGKALTICKDKESIAMQW